VGAVSAPTHAGLLENNSMEARSLATRYLASIGIVLLCSPASPAFAFTPELHSEFADKAVEAYQTCPGVTLPEPLGKALAGGTKAEDSDPLTAVERITNWHFYNRNQTLKPFWFFQRNLDSIFITRTKALNELLEDPDSNPVDVYKQAGRVLHYIQDMSVPGHVVPTYHIKDPFDGFGSIDALPKFSLSAEECQKLHDDAATETASPGAFLENAAKATLRQIEQTGADDKPVANGGWAAYWVYPSPDSADAQKGWGDYGVCPFSKGSGIAGCKQDEELVALFEHQYEQALKNSVRMLFYLQKRLDTSAVKTPAAQ
jgi:hypothetical protein